MCARYKVSLGLPGMLDMLDVRTQSLDCIHYQKVVDIHLQPGPQELGSRCRASDNFLDHEV
jgi:hypothetical protein